MLPFLRLSKVQSLCFWQKVDVCLSIWLLGVGLGIFFAQCQNYIVATVIKKTVSLSFLHLWNLNIMSNDDGKKSQPCKGLAIPMKTRFSLMFSNLLREKIFELENIVKKILQLKKHPIMFLLVFLVLLVKMHSFRERKREKRNVWETNGRTIKRLKQERTL